MRSILATGIGQSAVGPELKATARQDWHLHGVYDRWHQHCSSDLANMAAAVTTRGNNCINAICNGTLRMLHGADHRHHENAARVRLRHYGGGAAEP